MNAFSAKHLVLSHVLLRPLISVYKLGDKYLGARKGLGIYPDGMVEHDGQVGQLLKKLDLASLTPQSLPPRRRNINTGFGLAESLARAKNLAEVMELQAA